MVCEFIHAIFLAEPEIVRVVLFEGVPPAMLPVLFAHVPSMHVATDFVEAMVQQTDVPARQVFGLVVTGYLACHYPIPSVLVIVRAALVRVWGVF